MTANSITRRDMPKVSGLTTLGIGGVLSVGMGARAATSGVFGVEEGTPYDAWVMVPGNGTPRALVAADPVD